MLPYGRQSISEADLNAVVEVLRGDFLTTGPAVERFEAALVSVTAAQYAVVCANGTAALHLAALALDLGPGDAVVVPTMTFLATANAARYVGAEVVFADVDAESGLMGPEHLEAALGRAKGLAVRTVFPVHLNGPSVDLAAIAPLARRHGLAVVADACHAIGGRYQGAGNDMVPVGAGDHVDMTVFSFHPVKTVTMGEGGALTTADPRLAERLRLLRNHGMTREPSAFVDRTAAFDGEGRPNPWYYEMRELGYNYRATDLQCALGATQLARLETLVARRRELAERYHRLLTPLSPAVAPPVRPPHAEPAWHLYAVRIDFERAGVERGEVMRRLRERGIGSQVHYLPVHRQPYYRERYGDLALTGADRYYERALSLPLFPDMKDDDVDRVVAALGDVLRLV